MEERRKETGGQEKGIVMSREGREGITGKGEGQTRNNEGKDDAGEVMGDVREGWEVWKEKREEERRGRKWGWMRGRGAPRTTPKQ